jgi:hypothetical protein
VLNRTLDTSWCSAHCGVQPCTFGTVWRSPQRNECIFQSRCIEAVLLIIGEDVHTTTTKSRVPTLLNRGQRFINIEPQEGTIRRVNPPEA